MAMEMAQAHPPDSCELQESQIALPWGLVLACEKSSLLNPVLLISGEINTTAGCVLLVDAAYG